MKSYLFKPILLLVVILSAIHARAYDFSEVNEDGVTIYYNIVSEKNKTCEVAIPQNLNGWSSSMTLTHYEGDIRIPSSANGYKVVQIGKQAFLCCRNVTSVTMPNTVVYIRDYTFEYCTGLTSVTFSDSLKSIGSSCFSGCTALPSVTLPNSTVSIGSNAFENCKLFTSLTIPNSVTTIGYSAFSNCIGLTTVTIPRSVTNIGANPFDRCPDLVSIIVEDGNPNYNSANNCNAIINTSTKVLIAGCKNTVIPNDITAIGSRAFRGCTGLTSAPLPSTVTKIGSEAFANCSNLPSIEIPNGVTTIGSQAFYFCRGLTSLIIPDAVTSIGFGAFYGCSGLTSMTIPDSVKVIESMLFEACTGLTSINMPNTITSIGGWAFSDCTSLTSLTIPDSVKIIGAGAFTCCKGITSFVIPKSVESIGDYAFQVCTGLVSITSYITDVFETGVGAFNKCENATLYVPKGLVSDYQSTAEWNKFTNIEELPGVPIPLTLCSSDQGTVLINNNITFTNDIGEVTVYDETKNKFVFSPDEGSQLDRVLINGLDVTKSVKNNQLSTKILPNSKMNVMFTSKGADVNGDGRVDINDVVTLVNLILAM
jgi:hypothetical protein